MAPLQIAARSCDLRFQYEKSDDLSSDHLPIEVSIDALPHRNTSIDNPRYKFDQTDREVFKSTLEQALRFSEDFSGLNSTSDLDTYADFIVTAVSTAVDKAISKSNREGSESNSISA